MDLYALKIRIKFKGNSYKKVDFVNFNNKMMSPGNELMLYFSPDIMLTKDLLKKISAGKTDYLEYLFSNSAYIKLFNKIIRERKSRLVRKTGIYTFAEVIKIIKDEGGQDIDNSMTIEKKIKKLNKSIQQISKNITHNIKFIIKLIFKSNNNFYPEINSTPSNATIFNIYKYNWPPVRHTGKINIGPSVNVTEQKKLEPAGGAISETISEAARITIMSAARVDNNNWYNSTDIKRQQRNKGNHLPTIFSGIEFWTPNKGEQDDITSVAYPEWTYRLLTEAAIKKNIQENIKYEIKGYFYTSIDLILRKGASKDASASTLKNYRFICDERKRSIKNQFDHILHGYEDIEDDTRLDPVLYTSDNTGSTLRASQNNNPMARTLPVYPPYNYQNNLGRPALGQPALGRPALGQPALGQPALGQPPLAQPALARAVTIGGKKTRRKKRRRRGTYKRKRRRQRR